MPRARISYGLLTSQYQGGGGKKTRVAAMCRKKSFYF